MLYAEHMGTGTGLLLSIIHVGTGCLAHRASSSTGAIQHSRAFPVSTKSKMPATLLPPGCCLQCPRAGAGSGLDPLPVSPSLILATAEKAREQRGGALAVTGSLGRSQSPSSSFKGRLFIWRCKGNHPLPHGISMEGHHPGKRAAGIPRLPETAHPLGALSILSTCLYPLWSKAVGAGYCFSITLAISLILGTKLVL